METLKLSIYQNAEKSKRFFSKYFSFLFVELFFTIDYLYAGTLHKGPQASVR
jgi:hypothetical protein